MDELHLGRGAARFVRVLEHIDQRLLDLHPIEPARQLGQRFDAVKVCWPSQVRRRTASHGTALGSRRRQFGERRIAADELMQMFGAFRDCREHGRQSRIIAAPRNFGAGMRQRGQRTQGIVELVAQHSDQLFPGRDFLARQFARQPLQQVQPKGASLQDEGALRQMKSLFDALDFGGEQTVALPPPPRRAAPAGAASGRRGIAGPAGCARRSAGVATRYSHRQCARSHRRAPTPPASSASRYRAAIRAAPGARAARAAPPPIHCAPSSARRAHRRDRRPATN